MVKTKKLAAKKTTSKPKSHAKKAAAKKSFANLDAPMQSFKVARDTLPFFGMRITRQTVYWVILMVFIMIMQITILNIQLDVLRVTDSINSLH